MKTIDTKIRRPRKISKEKLSLEHKKLYEYLSYELFQIAHKILINNNKKLDEVFETYSEAEKSIYFLKEIKNLNFSEISIICKLDRDEVMRSYFCIKKNILRAAKV